MLLPTVDTTHLTFQVYITCPGKIWCLLPPSRLFPNVKANIFKVIAQINQSEDVLAIETSSCDPLIGNNILWLFSEPSFVSLIKTPSDWLLFKILKIFALRTFGYFLILVRTLSLAKKARGSICLAF